MHLDTSFITLLCDISCDIYSKIFLAKNVIIEGILAIQAGESPTLIGRKLGSFILGASSKGMEDNG